MSEPNEKPSGGLLDMLIVKKKEPEPTAAGLDPEEELALAGELFGTDTSTPDKIKALRAFIKMELDKR